MRLQTVARRVSRFCLLSAMATLPAGCYLASTDGRFNYGLTESSSSKQEAGSALKLQHTLNSLTIGSSDLSDVQASFGKPERLRDGTRWRVYWRPWKTMGMQHAEYPHLGVSFSLLTEPSRLYSVTVDTQDIAIRSLRVGDTLQDVRRVMGEGGWWWSTEGRNYFWLDFTEQGLRFAFNWDKGHEKYPKRLVKPETVTKIERYDRTVEFFEGWVNFRFFEPPPISK